MRESPEKKPKVDDDRIISMIENFTSNQATLDEKRVSLPRSTRDGFMNRNIEG